MLALEDKEGHEAIVAARVREWVECAPPLTDKPRVLGISPTIDLPALLRSSRRRVESARRRLREGFLEDGNE